MVSKARTFADKKFTDAFQKQKSGVLQEQETVLKEMRAKTARLKELRLQKEEEERVLKAEKKAAKAPVKRKAPVKTK